MTNQKVIWLLVPQGFVQEGRAFVVAADQHMPTLQALQPLCPENDTFF
jgi:hypothetical protein